MAYHRIQDTSNGLLAGKINFRKLHPNNDLVRRPRLRISKLRKQKANKLFLRVAIEISKNLHFFGNWSLTEIFQCESFFGTLCTIDWVFLAISFHEITLYDLKFA